MAFSTQKDFLHIAYMNERPEAKCIPMEGVRLKTYASTTDQRAWSMSKDKQAQYLTDLVACRTYPHEGGTGDGPILNAPKESLRSGKISEPHDVINKRDVSRHKNELSPVVRDDSLIHAAIEKMTQFEDLLAEKDDLKSQLKLSEEKEKLNIFKDQKETIDLRNEHYPEMSAVLERKIYQLRCSSKIDKNDENELLKILDGLNSREKAHKVLDAQNSYLRRLVEKLSQRSRLANISVKSETSTDIAYLQRELNNLRKEVSLLRTAEDEQLQSGIQASATLTDIDAENVTKILAERNALREKCQHFAGIERKIVQWKRDAEQLQSMRCAVKKRDEEIEDCVEEIEELRYRLDRMDKCLKGKEQTVEYWKEENRKMQKEICKFKYDLSQVSQLQGQVQCLSEKLYETNCIIEQYDLQFQHLLTEVENLQKNGSVDIRSLQDVESQTHNEHIEELAATTRATLDQISKELENRQVLEADLAQCRNELETVRRESQKQMETASADLNAKELENNELKESLQETTLAVRHSYSRLNLETRQGENCATQVERLEGLIIELKSQHEIEKESFEKKSTEQLHDLKGKQKELQSEVDVLKQSLNTIENEKRQLQIRNDDLSKTLLECQNKMKAQKDQLDKLDIKTIGLESELRSSKANLKEVGILVKDISSVQERNENLKSVLDAADNSEVLKQEIENLKKHLEEEKTKSGKIAQQNKQLQSALNEAKNVIQSQKVAATKTKEVPSVQKPKSSRTDTGAAHSQLSASEAKESRDGTDAITPGGNGADTIRRSAASPAGAAVSSKQSKPSEKKSNSKLAHIQKLHEAQRNADRSKYEKEIDGHRLSNEVLRKSITKLTTQMQSKSASDFDREFRTILDNFMHETCMWRCEKNCQKLTKLQDICKKIVEIGIDHLTHRELLYLHQQISEAALRLRPPALNTGRELKCCKCSGDICYAPMIPKENEKVLLEKSILERDIQSARDNLRQIKEEQDTWSTDTDQIELETMRPHTLRLNNEIRNSSGRARPSRYYAIQEEFEIPTKDKCGS